MECASHCVVWSWRRTTDRRLWIAEFWTVAAVWFVYGTASHNPRVEYHTPTQAWARICTGEVCLLERALIYDPEASTCFAILRFKWRGFVLICVLQVSRWSWCSPRYLTSVCIGIGALFTVTCGQIARVVVNVTWADFAWLILIFHVSNQAWRMSRWSWRCCEAMLGSEWTASSPVSSAKVAMVVWSVVGRSAVNIK